MLAQFKLGLRQAAHSAAHLAVEGQLLTPTE